MCIHTGLQRHFREKFYIPRARHIILNNIIMMFLSLFAFSGYIRIHTPSAMLYELRIMLYYVKGFTRGTFTVYIWV